MRVLYHLTTSDLKNIPEEARWAESQGFDGLCTDETGHDPFLPLLLAAGAPSQVTLEPEELEELEESEESDESEEAEESE